MLQKIYLGLGQSMNFYIGLACVPTCINASANRPRVPVSQHKRQMQQTISWRDLRGIH